MKMFCLFCECQKENKVYFNYEKRKDVTRVKIILY